MRGPRIQNGEQIVSSTNEAGETLQPHAKEQKRVGLVLSVLRTLKTITTTAPWPKTEGEGTGFHPLPNEYIAVWRRGLCHWGWFANVAIQLKVISIHRPIVSLWLFSFSYISVLSLAIIGWYIKPLIVTLIILKANMPWNTYKMQLKIKLAHAI